jgi:hypothetical protein
MAGGVESEWAMVPNSRDESPEQRNDCSSGPHAVRSTYGVGSVSCIADRSVLMSGREAEKIRDAANGRIVKYTREPHCPS